MADFGELNLSDALLRSLKDMGFEEPTPVQARAIPALMAGRDVVAQALTGTGKTAAFGIPLVEKINPRHNYPQAIVLAPTRELAIQVEEHLSQLGRHRNLRLVAIYGGQPIERQLRALARGVHAIIATPGRLMDHMRRGSVDLSNVSLIVLDEADQMLQMGFQEDVEYVMGHLTEGHATALFSATMPQSILDIIHRYMRDPEMLQLSQPRALTVPKVEQIYYVVPFPRKVDGLCRILDARQPERSMVFCATKRMVDEVTERLKGRGYIAEGLHGDVTQSAREKVLRSFREGRTEVLVATDVAARGLDVPEVAMVINFDIPPDPEYYVHRIGRTARSGRSGLAVTFINPREMRELQLIERVTGARIKRAELPTVAEAEERELQQFQERLLDVLDRGNWQQYSGLVQELTQDHEPLEIAAAALAMAAARTRRPASQAAETAPAERDSYDAPRRPQEPSGRGDRHQFKRGPGKPYGAKPSWGGPRRGADTGKPKPRR